ncbi:MAG: CopG family transcriptional regulator [Terriglobia bacterium]
MKRKIRYTDEPMDELKVIDDFLPPPEQLASREDKVKITIALSKASVEFFKMAAKENKTQYQKMIRGLLDYYAAKFHKVADRRVHSVKVPMPDSTRSWKQTGGS